MVSTFMIMQIYLISYFVQFGPLFGTKDHYGILSYYEVMDIQQSLGFNIHTYLIKVFLVLHELLENI